MLGMFYSDISRTFGYMNVADIKKLKSVGICTIKGIQMTTRRALCNVKGLSEAKVDKIKEAANKLIRQSKHESDAHCSVVLNLERTQLNCSEHPAQLLYLLQVVYPQVKSKTTRVSKEALAQYPGFGKLLTS
ncbi:hypothetical protein CB1_000175005 [Camelus ferus]|nr:hypothetical protein CB1_000175005 [Camelus ferus]